MILLVSFSVVTLLLLVISLEFLSLVTLLEFLLLVILLEFFLESEPFWRLLSGKQLVILRLFEAVSLHWETSLVLVIEREETFWAVLGISQSASLSCLKRNVCCFSSKLVICGKQLIESFICGENLTKICVERKE